MLSRNQRGPVASTRGRLEVRGRGASRAVRAQGGESTGGTGWHSGDGDHAEGSAIAADGHGRAARGAAPAAPGLAGATEGGAHWSDAESGELGELVGKQGNDAAESRCGEGCDEGEGNDDLGRGSNYNDNVNPRDAKRARSEGEQDFPKGEERSPEGDERAMTTRTPPAECEGQDRRVGEGEHEELQNDVRSESTTGREGRGGPGENTRPSIETTTRQLPQQSPTKNHAASTTPADNQRSRLDTDTFRTEDDRSVRRTEPREHTSEEAITGHEGCLDHANASAPEGRHASEGSITDDRVASRTTRKSCEDATFQTIDPVGGRLAPRLGRNSDEDALIASTTDRTQSSMPDKETAPADTAPVHAQFGSCTVAVGSFQEYRPGSSGESTVSTGTTDGIMSQTAEIKRRGSPRVASASPPMANPLSPLLQKDNGATYAPPAGSCPLFNGGVVGRLERSEEVLKCGALVVGSACKDKRSSDGGGLLSASRSDGNGVDRSGEESPPPGGASLAPTALAEGLSHGDAPSVPFRGTKRPNVADITLAQVIDHMARRRLNEAVGGKESLADRDAGRSSSSASGNAASANSSNGINSKSLPATQRPVQDGSAVVAAAWANGCVLPLTAVAASHMRLVSPLLAGEPEGRRVIIRTASTVVAAAAVSALPEYCLEVTGVCRDGLLFELSPKTGLQGGLVEGGGTLSELVPVLARRLQAAFDRLVALDLEFDTVRVPHIEALDTVSPRSSSGELLKWCNDGTATVVSLAHERLPDITVKGGTQGSGANSENNERRDGLSQQGRMRFRSVDCDVGPLLPRTGLLGCFGVDIRPVVCPLPEPTAKRIRTRGSSALHVALILSCPGVFHGSGLGGTTALPGACKDTVTRRSSARARESGGVVPSAAVVALRHLSSRLGCVPPTCTAGGLTWRDITGLKCVAAVSRLAVGPRIELEGKIRLAEELHRGQVSALARERAC